MSMLTAEKSNLETSLKKAKSVISSVEVSKLKLKDEKSFESLRRVQTLMVEARDHLASYPRTELRKEAMLRVDKIFNATASAIDLIERDEYSSKDTQTFVEKLNSRVRRVYTTIGALNAERDKSVKKKEAEGSTNRSKGVFAGRGIFDYYDSKDYVDEAPKDDNVMKAINNSEDVIKHYQKFAKQLPATEADAQRMGDFILQRMPVVALTDPAVTAPEFEKAGFVTRPIGFYAVLENQLIMGIRENVLKTKKMDPKTYAKFVLQKVEREMHAKYQMIGQPTGYKNSGYVYYWLVPEKNIDQLRTRAHKALTVKRWYFAFK